MLALWIILGSLLYLMIGHQIGKWSSVVWRKGNSRSLSARILFPLNSIHGKVGVKDEGFLTDFLDRDANNEPLYRWLVALCWPLKFLWSLGVWLNVVSVLLLYTIVTSPDWILGAVRRMRAKRRAAPPQQVKKPEPEGGRLKQRREALRRELAAVEEAIIKQEIAELPPEPYRGSPVKARVEPVVEAPAAVVVERAPEVGIEIHDVDDELKNVGERSRPRQR